MRRIGTATCVVLLASVALAAASVATIPNSVAPYVTSAKNLGAENPGNIITIEVRLALHNVAQRDALLAQLYDTKSPLYQKWLTPEEYAARFGPTAQEAAAVQDFLKSQGLSITGVNKFNYTVSAQGTIADIQKAFGVQINRFQVNGETRYANINNPSVPANLAGVVSSIGGLHQVMMKYHHVFPVDPSTGKEVLGQQLASGGQQYYEYQCYRGTELHAYTTGGKLPIGYYSGNRYGADANNNQNGHLPPCGFEPLTVQTAYGLIPVYQSGLDGTGQAVAIVDAYGSPTAAADYGKFSTTFGLPTSGFSKYDPQGPPPYDPGWAGETTLDIEWSHSMAPGAAIVLIETIDNQDINLRGGIQYALDNKLANVVSNSYGSDEYEDNAQNMQAWDDLGANAAMLGVSLHFSSGDSGDFYRDVGHITVSVPSNSPHVTSVGGASLFVNADYSIQFQTGWGTTITRIAEPPNNTPDIPPVCQSTLQPGKCFYYGGGGGMSQFFPKPSWQSGLPGTGRQQPDISLPADPYTGATIIYSYNNPGTYTVAVIGGTSASCPMFSGVWAIVNQKSQQKNGHSAGYSAPYLYSLPKNAVYDIVQASQFTPLDLAGEIFTGAVQPMYESAAGLVGPDVPTQFTSAFYQSPSSKRWYDLGFGSDSSLTTGPGWDNVTGVGTPNGANFINAIVP
jgi:subtilase family serine protease